MADPKDYDRDRLDLQQAREHYAKVESDLASARAWLTDAERRMHSHWNAMWRRAEERVHIR